MAYFALNAALPVSDRVRYVDVSRNFVWDATAHAWRHRRQGQSRVIPRLVEVSARQGERHYLRSLLQHVYTATSFEDLGRPCDGSLRILPDTVPFPTFREAAIRLGLQNDVDMGRDTLRDLRPHATAPQLLRVLAQLCLPTVGDLWAEVFQPFHDDPQNNFPSRVCDHLRSYGMTPTNTTLPTPQPLLDRFHATPARDRELRRWHTPTLHRQAEENTSLLNAGQRALFDAVVSYYSTGRGGLFFVDGPAGTGKSFVNETLVALVRGRGDIALCMAWSGLAATLLPGGCTVHSIFKLPVPLPSSDASSGLKIGTDAADLVRDAKLLIWDEAPNAPRAAFDVVEKACRFVAPALDKDKHFGGKIVVLAGDFRQLPPVVHNNFCGNDIVAQSLRSWPLFNSAHVFPLTENVRARQDASFANWVMLLGDGEVPGDEVGRHTSCVAIPGAVGQMDTVDDMLDWVAEGTMGAPELWKHRAIVCSTNDDANYVNVQMQGKLSGDETVYLSRDTVHEDADGAAEMFPDDYLHELHPAGLPPHRPRVKAGAVMILTRNIALDEDLCNGTRVYVLRTFASAVEVYVFRTGRTHFIPRLTTTSTDESGLPVVLYRTQIPLTYGYALTVHKSQGQSYNDRLGIFLSQPVFPTATSTWPSVGRAPSRAYGCSWTPVPGTTMAPPLPPTLSARPCSVSTRPVPPHHPTAAHGHRIQYVQTSAMRWRTSAPPTSLHQTHLR